MKLKLACSHFPKKIRLTYSCEKTGDYKVDLCDDCYRKEDKQFLISEEML